MFREMRKLQRQLSREDTIQILASAGYGFLAINGGEYPYGVPINYVYVNDKVYFHCAEEGQKLDMIKENNKVSFTAVSKHDILPDKFSTDYRSVVLFGEVEEVTGEEKLQALEAFIRKFSSDFTEEGMKYIEKAAHRTRAFAINIKHVTGKGRV